MIKKNKIIGAVGLGSLISLFAILYVTIPHFINDDKIRNRNYNPAHLKECKCEIINKEISNYSLEFENSKKYIFTRVYTNQNSNIRINGYHDSKLLETSLMKKENNECYNFTFNWDYYNINNISLSMDKAILVNKVVVYYIN